MPQRAKSQFEHYLADTKSQARPPAASNFVGGRPKCPKHLSPIAKEEFRRCVRLLEKRRTITPGDAGILALYAEILARWINAKQQMGDDLIKMTTITNNRGEAFEVEKVNPLLKIVDQCEAKLVRLETRLGLTPTDREKSRPTAKSNTEEVIPGSLADTNPELFAKVTPINGGNKDGNQ